MSDRTVQKIRVSSGDFLVVEKFGAEPGELLGDAERKAAGKLTVSIVRAVDRAELTGRQRGCSKQSHNYQAHQRGQSCVRLRHASQVKGGRNSIRYFQPVKAVRVGSRVHNDVMVREREIRRNKQIRPTLRGHITASAKRQGGAHDNELMN